jgi:hypothetical protein
MFWNKFWNKTKKEEIPEPKEEKKVYLEPYDFDTRLTRVEMKIHELFAYLLETDKYSGKKKLTKAGQSVKRALR